MKAVSAAPQTATRAYRAFASAGAVCGAFAVLLGAFGAHALQGRLDAAALQTWHTAVDYQFWHALALLVIATQASPPRHARAAAILFCVGIVLFCGSLYALALGASRAIGAVTPFGGLALICAWLLLAIGLLRSREQ